MGRITAQVLKRAAEGGFGKTVQDAYWLVAGRKTQIAALLAFGVGVVEVAHRSGACSAVGLDCAGAVTQAQHAALFVAGGLAYLGQVDGALRTPEPGK